MADKRFNSLPGFRDFAPDDCAIRNYFFAAWRSVAHRYGFVEYEAPILEETALYQKKAGDELNTQLFRFVDQGKRDIATVLSGFSESPENVATVGTTIDDGIFYT